MPPAEVAGAPPTARLLVGQLGTALRAAWRDPASQFFAVVMPVGLYLFILATQPVGLLEDGTPFVTFFAASMSVWGAGVTAFMNLPEQVAFARDRRVLKRLRGTPLEGWHYLVGRTGAALVLAVVIAAAVLTLGITVHDLRITPLRVLLGTAVLLLGTVVLAACGLALASLVRDAKAVSALGLVVLLPLAFFSDVFVVGGPAWMRTVGAFFPLRPLQNAVAQAWADGTVDVGALGVLVAWGVVGTLVAVRTFRWSPRETPPTRSGHRPVAPAEDLRPPRRAVPAG